jgi:hypothetical protein
VEKLKFQKAVKNVGAGGKSNKWLFNVNKYS